MEVFDNVNRNKPESPPEAYPAKGEGWKIGDKIDHRYEIRRILGGPGKSGMGIAYVCYVTTKNLIVVLKTFQDRLFYNQAAIDQFKWEAEAWVRLGKHHNIVRANHVEMIAKRPFIAMDYIASDSQYGADLSGWINRGGLRHSGQPDIPLIINFSIQFCHGMMHAESKFREMGKAFIHRDIKPSNIMITRDRVVKITDFGLVKAFTDMDVDIPLQIEKEGKHRKLHLSKFGHVCGTPPYMSPEQCKGEVDIDIRSDIYSFGCVLYEMLTERPAFNGHSVNEYLQLHLNYTPPPTGLDRDLDSIIMKCIQKDKSQRFQSFSELERKLAQIYRNLTGSIVNQPQVASIEAWELINRGFSLSHLGYHDEAINCLHEAIKIDPKLPDAYANLGIAYCENGQLDIAINEFREAIKVDPDYSEAHHNLGIAYYKKGQLDAAMAEFKEALKIDPCYSDAHNSIGAAFADKGNYDAAMAAYKEALKINPNNIRAHHNLAALYRDNGNKEAAIAEYKEILNINPNISDTHHDLAMIAYKKGEFDVAIAELREMLRINPGDVKAYINLGSVYGANGQWDTSMVMFREALRIDPTDAMAHYNMGVAYMCTGKLDYAISEYKEALRIDPHYMEPHSNLGLIYLNRRQFHAAISEYVEALKIDSSNAEVHYSLGNAYMTMDNLDAAILEYREAIRLNPQYARAYVNLGLVLILKRQLDAGMAECREALKIDPNIAEAHHNIGVAYIAKNLFDGAIIELESALRIDPNHTSAYYNLALVFEQIGKYKDSIDHWSAYIRLAQGTPSEEKKINEAKQHIAHLEKKL